jgi:hypothetical protein
MIRCLRAFEAINEVALCSCINVCCISCSSFVWILVIALILSSSAFEIIDTSYGLAASAAFLNARLPSAVAGIRLAALFSFSKIS